MKKLLALFLSACMLATAGCSNSGGGTSQAGSTDPEGGSSAQSQEGEDGVKLTMSYWGSTVEDEAVKKMCEVYKSETGITVEPLYVPNADYTTKMSSLIASNSAPDIAYIFTTDVYKWADEGLFVEIYEMLENDPDYSYEDFIPQAFLEYEPGKAAGRRIATETINLYYNKDLFDEAGVDYLPSKWEDALTWDEFLDVCKRLTLDANGNNAASDSFDPNNIVQYGFNLVKDYDGWGSWILNNGGQYYNEDGTEFTMSDPKCVNAIQFLADLCNVHHVMPNPTTAATQNNNGAAQSLMTGAVAIYQDGQWTCLDFDGMDFNWDTAVMPVGPDADENAPYTYTTCAPICIFKSTEHLDEAWDFYMWLCDPNSALDLYKDGLWMPLLKDWYEDEEKLAMWTDSPARPEGYQGALVDMSLNHVVAVEADYVSNFDQMDAIIEPALETVWMGTATAEDAIASINVDSLLEGSRRAVGPQK